MRVFILGIVFLILDYYRIPIPSSPIFLMLIIGGVFCFIQDFVEITKK